MANGNDVIQSGSKLERLIKEVNEAIICLDNHHYNTESLRLAVEDYINEKEKILTKDKLEKTTYGIIFMEGLTVDSPDGINMTNSGKALRWIAKRGYGKYDWAIYIYWAEYDAEYIALNGDKVLSESNIKKLVKCTDKAFSLYRL